jgi:prophage tail gpP-like protein
VVEIGGRRVSFAGLTMTRGVELAMSIADIETHEVLFGEQGQKASIRWNGEQVFAGYVEPVNGNSLAGYSVGLRSLVVGLDKVDALGNEHFPERNTVRGIASALAGLAGVAVGAIPDAPVNRWRLKRGTSFRSALQQLVQSTQLVVTDDAQGRLVMFGLEERPDVAPLWQQGRSPTLDAFQISSDTSDIRAEYRVRGRRALVDGDFDSTNDEEIAEGLAAAALPASRKVLPNKAAASRGDAASLLDWTAKTAIAKAYRVVVNVNEYPGDPGFARLLRGTIAIPGVAEQFAIDEILIATEVRSDFVTSQFSVGFVLPESYLRRQRTAQARYTGTRQWRKAGRTR